MLCRRDCPLRFPRSGHPRKRVCGRMICQVQEDDREQCSPSSAKTRYLHPYFGCPGVSMSKFCCCWLTLVLEVSLQITRIMHPLVHFFTWWKLPNGCSSFSKSVTLVPLQESTFSSLKSPQSSVRSQRLLLDTQA